jgi:hypothetical protein
MSKRRVATKIEGTVEVRMIDPVSANEVLIVEEFLP